MTSKLIVNSLAADTGVSTITFADQAKMGNAIFHSTGFTIGDSFLHSTGVNITNINATGVITATKFVGEVSVGSSITFEDNEKAYFGTGTDFSIYHNGSASYLDETGTGGLIAKTNTAFQVFNSAGSQPAFTVTPGGSVDLYHNTSKVLETKAYGIDITGGFVATGDCSIADKITHAGDLNTAIRFPAGDTFSIETGGNEVFNITYNRIGLNGTIPTASHANVTSSIHLADSNTILSRTGNQYFALYQNLKQTSADVTRYLVNGYASAYVQHTGTHRFYTVGNGTGNTNATVTERLRITNDGKMGLNHNSPPSQFVVRAPGGSGHCSSQVHSGDSTTIMNMQTVQGSEGRFGMNTDHNLAIYTNGLEKLHLSKTGSLFLKCLDTVPVNQAESGHYASTGYNAGHVLGLMVKRSICVSDADTKGVGGIFLSHTRNVACDGTTYNMMTLHNREGTFVGDVYVGFAAGGAGVVRHYKFTCLYSANTLTSIDNASRGGKSETISVNISSSNDAHFFQVIPNMSTNETCRVSMTIVGAACGRNDGASGDYYTVNYN